MRHCTFRTCGLLAALIVAGILPLWSAGYGQLPLTFEANRGQADAQVLYLARGQGYGLFLGRNSATLRLVSKSRVADLRVSLTGAASPLVEGTGPLSGATRYYRGQDPSQWIADVPTFARVRYSGVYPGVDLVFYGNQRSLEYDFVVAPGADPRAIALAFDGASRLQVDPSGDLLLSVPGGQVRLLKPVAYQEIAGVRRTVAARYRLHGGSVGFALGAYDASRPLIVDPTLNYSSYLGGSDLDGAAAIAVDASGNASIAGWTVSANFPTTSGAYQTSAAGLTDAFVAKVDPLGQTLLFSTFLGGSGDDTAEGIAVDAAGSVYVVGSTQSANFPTLHPLQSYGGNGDGFISKLTSSGTLVYSTFLGGAATDDARAVAVDSSANAYVAGMTASSNFPVTAGAYQAALAGASDAFVVKLNAAGSAATYATYLGGSGTDEANAIAVDSSGDTWVGGFTWSSAFPTQNPRQTYGGSEDGFVTKLNPAGTGLLFSTFLGGSSLDLVTAIAVDGNGNAYVAGSTGSSDFPVTSGVVQHAPGGFFLDEDAFVVKYNSTGSQVMYSTYLGGSGDDIAYAIAVDAQGYAYVAGETASSNFPVLNSLQSFGGGVDAFVTVLNANGTALVFSTFLGGAGDDTAKGIATDANGRVYVAGETNSTNFPVSPAGGALQASAGGGIEDAFVAAMQFCSYSLGVLGNPFPANGGTGTLVINAAVGCPWSAASTVPWITPGTPVSGNGSGTVGFTVAPNASSQTLTGALTAGWQSGQVTETGITCTYNLGSNSASAGAAGGLASFTVTPSSSGCTWTATSNASWITVTGGSPGTGAGTVNYSVAATTSINQRSGTITAAGQTFTVTEQGGTATFSLSPASATPGAGGGTATVGVVCNLTDASWTASSNSAWLTITSGTPGSGSGSVGYSVAANNSVNSRSGSLTIAGLAFPVTQSGATPVFSLNPASVNVGAAAASGTVTITGTPPDAPWTAASNASWITVSSGSSGTGSGSTGYIIGANVSPSGRVGTITIAGQTFTVTQAGTASSLSVTKTHTGNFIQGQQGATYAVTVSNAAGSGVTVGTVTVTDTFPTGLTLVSMSGTGWGCSGNTCTRSDVLNPGSSYPAITVTVNVAANATSPLTNQATVSGGGSAGASASDVTTIAGGWIDNFESYSLGSFPSANWQASGSTNTSVVNSTYVSPVQSAQLHGDIGACWAAIIYRQIPVSPPYTIQFYARNGNESLSGCHPERASAELQGGPSWTASSRGLFVFHANGAFATDSTGPAFPLLTWVKVRITYERPDANTVRIGYWLNDQFYQSITTTPMASESQLTWLGLFSQEGTAWFDDASVTSGLPLVPSLSVAKTHTGNFAPGQQGATYTVTVSNAAGTAASTGTVTVTDTIPTGLTLVSMSGTGWSCSGNTCTRSDVLNPGSSYPSITATVNVGSNATSPQVNSVSVSGGGSTPASATDSTIISATSHPAFFSGEAVLSGNVYSLTFPDGNLFGYYGYLSGGWVYHFDMGYVFVSPGIGPEVYLWDLASGHWWYTNSSLFPYLYDFTLHAWLYYFPDTHNAGHYTTNPRYFANMSTGTIITM